MKKNQRTLAALTLVICLLLAYIVGFVSSVRDQEAWDHYGEQEAQHAINLQRIVVSDREAFKRDFLDLARDYGVDILMTGQASEENQLFQYKAFFPGSRGSGQEDSSKQTAWTLRRNDRTVIPLAELTAPFLIQTGRGKGDLYDAFRDDDVRFMDLESAWENFGFKQRYLIRGTGAWDFTDALAERLNMESQDLSRKSSNFVRSSLSTLGNIALFLCLNLGVLYAMVALAFLAEEQKNIVILRLHGYGYGAIAKYYLSKLMAFTIVVLLVTSLALALYAGNFRVGLTLLVVLSLVMVVFGTFILLVIAWTSRHSQNLYLKGKRPSRGLYNAGQVALVLFSIFFVYIVLVEGHSVTGLLKIHRDWPTWQRYQDYGVLASRDIGDNLDSITGGRDTQTLEDRALFDGLWDEGAVYFASNPGQSFLKRSFAVVNDAYLNDFGEDLLADEATHLLTTLHLAAADPDGGTARVLIPGEVLEDPGYRGDGVGISAALESDISGFMERYFQVEQQAERSYPLFEDEDRIIPKVPAQIEVYVYPSRPIWPLDLAMDPQERARQHLPVHPDDSKYHELILMDLPLSSFSSITKSGSSINGTRGSLKLPPGWANGGAREAELDALLLASGLADNALDFRSIDQYHTELMSTCLKEIQVGLGILLLVLCVSLFSGRMVQIMRQSLFRREWVIAQLHGYSFWELHAPGVLPATLTMLLGMVAAMYFYPAVRNPYAYPILLVSLMVYLTTWFFSARQIARKSFVSTLKGV